MSRDLLGALWPPWMKRASCRGMDVALWVESATGDAKQFALEVCGDCPVREQCLAYSLEHGLLIGIWGGRTQAERRRMHKEAA